MTNEIAPIKSHIAGNSIIFGPYTVEYDDGTARDISQDTINWRVFDRKDKRGESDALISLDTTGVSLEIINASAGEFRIVVEQGVTSDLDQRAHYHRVIIDGPDNRQQTWIGKLYVGG